jgi:hypothetical protein
VQLFLHSMGWIDSEGRCVAAAVRALFLSSRHLRRSSNSSTLSPSFYRIMDLDKHKSKLAIIEQGTSLFPPFPKCF